MDSTTTSSRIDAVLAAADRAQARLNCFIAIDREGAMGRAADLDRGGPDSAGPLAGIPFAYKDVFAGCPGPASSGVGHGHGWPLPGTSVTLERLRRAGAVPVGSLNLDPHCYGATGLNPYFGRVLNPLDPRFATGGSSSGAAAAVAAGVVPFSIGTDTGGSVRIPAALCGVYGFKPTAGAVADPGIVPLSPSQDTVGVIAASPALLGEVLRALGIAGEMAATAPERGLRIGLDPAGLCAGLDPEVEAALAATIDRLRGLGVEIREIRFPPPADLNACASVITGFEAFALHRERLAERPDWYPAAVARRLEIASRLGEADYQGALERRRQARDAVLADGLAAVDMILCPTIRVRAPRVDGLAEDDADTAGRMTLEFLSLNRPFSLLGLPSLSIPAGRDDNGLPIGMQLVGRPGEDARLVALAGHLQQGAGVAAVSS